MTELKAGEEVDWEDACAVESAKVQQYTFDMIDHYKMHNYQYTTEKQRTYYTPRMPYHQDF